MFEPKPKMQKRPRRKMGSVQKSWLASVEPVSIKVQPLMEKFYLIPESFYLNTELYMRKKTNQLNRLRTLLTIKVNRHHMISVFLPVVKSNPAQPVLIMSTCV